MSKKEWSWLPAHMPTVTREMAELRKVHGQAHVAECWRQGVLLGEPGHFFAAEGVLTIGTATAEQLVHWCDMRAGNPAAHMVCLGSATGQGGATC